MLLADLSTGRITAICKQTVRTRPEQHHYDFTVEKEKHEFSC
jgi:hypothetical protein